MPLTLGIGLAIDVHGPVMEESYANTDFSQTAELARSENHH